MMKTTDLRQMLLLCAGALLLLATACKKDENGKVADLVDIEGNEYRTVKIGNQEWMAENLKTSKFNDGAQIFPFPDAGG